MIQTQLNRLKFHVLFMLLSVIFVLIKLRPFPGRVIRRRVNRLMTFLANIPSFRLTVPRTFLKFVITFLLFMVLFLLLLVITKFSGRLPKFLLLWYRTFRPSSNIVTFHFSPRVWRDSGRAQTARVAIRTRCRFVRSAVLARHRPPLLCRELLGSW